MKKRNVALVFLIFVCMAAVALMPALAKPQNLNSAGSAGDSDKFLHMGKDAIPGHYIVVLDADAAGKNGDLFSTASMTSELTLAYGGAATNIYAYAINGFSAQMSEEQALKLSSDPRVKFVEEDSIMSATITQNNPPWGLDRIGQRDLPLNAVYSCTTTGSGVNVYIIDTGIRRTHTQFGGRAFVGFDSVGDGQNTNDCNGHGTHVSGTVGGSTYGVAKSVRLFAVRVLNCSGSGSNAGVIAGVDWVTANHISPAVANMSLGGGVSTALDTAGEQFNQFRGDLCDCCGQLEYERGKFVARASCRCDHRRIFHKNRCSLVVLKLRQRRRYFRAGLEHTVVLQHQRYRNRNFEWNLDGNASRCRRRRAVLAKQSGRIPGHG